MIHLYHGDGQGKTSAANGLAIRGAGSGMQVLYTRFLKGGKSSELNSLEKLPNIHIHYAEKKFGFTWQMNEEELIEAKSYYTEYLNEVIQLVEDHKYGMLIMDEVIDAYNGNFILRQTLLDFLKKHGKELEIVMSGRNPDEEIIELSDYVSEVKKVKHPYDLGYSARKGVEL